jgi:hypothetical protein
MGVVYKARDTDLDRIVALKMIKGGLLATAEEVVRFHQEARAAACLDHPNIVPVYETGQEEGRLYFTMAFAWGGSLAQQQGRFVANPRAAAALLEKVAHAVHHAHERGILHRDLKPANILFDGRGIPWVGDFGLAKFVDASLELTRTDQLLGTPAYMAPEQAAGHTDQISPQTDVWALGVLLYELLTGQRPFKGVSQEEQFRKVRTMEPPRPRTINRALDWGLETVILKCLEKEPARRYGSAEALADDLARWQRGEPVLARPPSWLVRVGRIIRRCRRLVLQLGAAVALLALLWLVRKGGLPSVAPPQAPEAKPPQAPEAKPPQAPEAKPPEGKEPHLIQWQKGKMTLIGASGPPEGEPQWQLRRVGARTMLNRGVFQVQAGEQPSMLELLPYAPKRYRLRAQVQHIDGSLQGKVGIYFAHGKRTTEKATTHCFFRVAFNDRVPMEGQVRLTLPIYRETKEGDLSYVEHACRIERQFTPVGKVEPMLWRTLEAEVTPEWIRIFWERELIKVTPFGVMEANGCDPKRELAGARGFGDPISETRLKDGLPERVFVDAEPTLGKGIGLYVEQGVAAFRSVEIEPLLWR